MESGSEELLQFALAVDGAFSELHEPFKGGYLEGASEQTCQEIIWHHIANLSLEVADVLAWGPLAVEDQQGQNLEFWGI